jgi:hypothetical protein
MRLGVEFTVALPNDVASKFAPFIEKWKAERHIVSLETLDSTAGWIAAGQGYAKSI